jgi:hypothetical protein
VLIDETYAPNPREYTKAKFFAEYGINETMIASGDWPFLTYGTEHSRNMWGTFREHIRNSGEQSGSTQGTLKERSGSTTGTIQ